MYAIRSYYALAVDTGCACVGFDLDICAQESLFMEHAVVETVVDLRHLPLSAFPVSGACAQLLPYPRSPVLFYPVITSYSIHYTKLYEAWCGPAGC